MPIHDWTRVEPGTFHDFHAAWIVEIRNALNGGLLPPDYYALAEQMAGPLGPDVLTLQASADSADETAYEAEDEGSGASVVTLAVAPPKVRYTAAAEMDEYVLKRRTLVIRHASNDRIVALVEILSPGNKSSRHALRSFVDKVQEALYHGYHLLLADLHPPTIRDPGGIHAAIWSRLSDEAYQPPADKPLTLAAYSAGAIKRAFVEPVSVGDRLCDMPLFLEPEAYVNVPLDATYEAAWRGVPRRWQRVLEGGV